MAVAMCAYSFLTSPYLKSGPVHLKAYTRVFDGCPVQDRFTEPLQDAVGLLSKHHTPESHISKALPFSAPSLDLCQFISIIAHCCTEDPCNGI